MQTQARRSPRTNGQAYREYSRRRYRELKTQQAHMRESEMVEKIIREWENLSDDKKNKFARTLGNNQPLPEVRVENTPNKRDRALSLAKTNQKTTGAKDNRVEESSEEVREQIEGSSSNNILFPKATPAINKNGSKADYMTFFKFYYARTMRDHPNWTPNQATVIIKLLWRKRLSDIKKKVIPIKLATRCMSGRQAFGRAKKLEGFRVGQIAKMWRRLPLESRKVWEQNGDPNPSKVPQPSKRKVTMRLRLNKNSDGYEEGNNLSFLTRK